jgi:hypothetical protein
MIALLTMLQAVALAAAPGDWTALPPLRLTEQPDYALIMTKFVRDEVAAGRCAAPAPVEGKTSIKLDLIVLVASSSGEAVRVVPRAINCPTVEQFAAGVVQKATRGNIAGTTPSSDSWYRTNITITWGQ